MQPPTFYEAASDDTYEWAKKRVCLVLLLGLFGVYVALLILTAVTLFQVMIGYAVLFVVGSIGIAVWTSYPHLLWYFTQARYRRRAHLHFSKQLFKDFLAGERQRVGFLAAYNEHVIEPSAHLAIPVTDTDKATSCHPT